jgi:RNA-directed DNA polymerase
MEVKRLPVNSESTLKRVLDTLYGASQNEEPFYGLLELMTNEETIISAIHKIKGNQGSKTMGVDRKSMKYYLQMDRDKLIGYVKKCFANYEPLPVRRHYIPKANGKMRPLGIPAIIDRIIQECVRMVLEPICEAKFYPHSYGFRPYRATSHALASVVERIRVSKTYIAVEADIKSYFDNVDHDILLKVLWNMGIRDKRVLVIIKKMLRAGIMEDGKQQDSLLGTPQGGIISPLLANVYLNGFDWMISDLYLTHPATIGATHRNGHRRLSKKGHSHEPTFLIRYADDWIILCRTREYAETVLQKAEKYMKHKRKLEFAQEKTRIVDLRNETIKFLGFKVEVGTSIENQELLVGKLQPDNEKVTKKVREIADLIRELPNKPNDRARATQIEMVNSKIVGLTNYYSVSNAKSTFGLIDNRLNFVMVKAFWKMKGKKWRENYAPLKNFSNWRERHEKYETNSCFIEVDEQKIGITKAVCTPTWNNALKFRQEMTPYTEEGRKLYWASQEKREPLNRPRLYYAEDLYVMTTTSSRIYNFEYFMNREYAWNRDKGKCKCCSEFLYIGNYHCHHRRTKLPKSEINKVPNLASVCTLCHTLIHKATVMDSDCKTPKQFAKISKYREELRELILTEPKA